jgi:hypothetical protein
MIGTRKILDKEKRSMVFPFQGVEGLFLGVQQRVSVYTDL